MISILQFLMYPNKSQIENYNGLKDIKFPIVIYSQYGQFWY